MTWGVAFALHSKWAESEDMFRRAIKCDPSCAPAWSYLAKVLWDHGDSPQTQAEALQYAQHALALQPNLSDPHYVLARVAEFRGDLPDAIAEYNKALAMDDKDFTAHYNLGNCLLNTGHPGEAAGEYQKVIKNDPRDAPAWTNLGYANIAVGRNGEAEKCFRTALQIDPSLRPAQSGLRKVTTTTQ